MADVCSLKKPEKKDTSKKANKKDRPTVNAKRYEKDQKASESVAPLYINDENCVSAPVASQSQPTSGKEEDASHWHDCAFSVSKRNEQDKDSSDDCKSNRHLFEDSLGKRANNKCCYNVHRLHYASIHNIYSCCYAPYQSS